MSLCFYKLFEQFTKDHIDDPNYTELAEAFMLSLVLLDPKKAAHILVKYMRP